MPKRNFDKGRDERLQRLRRFKELPVKSPGSPLESLGPRERTEGTRDPGKPGTKGSSR